MLLVNAETRGSAEVLAGALRAEDRGIVIGSKTAGSAAGWEEVKLSDGRTLRIATAKIVVSPPGGTAQKIELFPDGLTRMSLLRLTRKRSTTWSQRANQ